MSNNGNGEGCTLVVLAIIGLIVWGLWTLFTGCWICSDSLLTKHCAKSTLASTCGHDQEIVELVSIDDVKDSRTQVVYDFKKIPLPGTILPTETFRATTAFVYQKNSKNEMEWTTVCTE
jgi:hypothetical protein